MAEFLSPLGEATLLGATVRESDGIVNFTRVREARMHDSLSARNLGRGLCGLQAERKLRFRGKGGAERGLHATI